MANERHSFVAFYPSDWLGGTARMTRLHKSVFFDVCCFIWDKAMPCPSGELPLMLGDLPNWRDLIEDLATAGKLVRTPDGSLYNPKALKEAEKARDLWAKQSKGGKDGATKTNSKRPAETPAKTPDAIPAASPVEGASGLPPQNLNQNLKEVAAVSAPAVSRETELVMAEARRICETFNVEVKTIFTSRKYEPHTTNFHTAMAMVREGYTADDCRPVFVSVLTRRCAGGKEPPASLSYFLQAIADAKAAANTPMPKGNANHGQQRGPVDLEKRAADDDAAILRGIVGSVDPGMVARVRAGEVPDGAGTDCADDPGSDRAGAETLPASEYRIVRLADAPADRVGEDVQPPGTGCGDGDEALSPDAMGPAGRPAGEGDLGNDTGSQVPDAAATGGYPSEGGGTAPVTTQAPAQAGNGATSDREKPDLDAELVNIPAHLIRAPRAA